MHSTKNISPKYIALATAWALLILFATIANVQTLKALRLSDLFSYDKPIHMLLFGMQAWLIFKCRRHAGLSFLAIACASAFAYGVLTELLQAWLTTTRFFDYWDMLANGLGCAVVWVWARKSKRVV
jgi:VanZ family protein